MPNTILPTLYRLILCCCFCFFQLPLGQANLVTIVPKSVKQNKVQKQPKTKKQKKQSYRWRSKWYTTTKTKVAQKAKKPQADIVGSLYLTFGILILLPVLLLTGFLLAYLGALTSLLAFIGLGLAFFSNLVAILAGVLAGSTKGYTTQIFCFALWVFAGLNIAGAVALAFPFLLATPFAGIIGGFFLLLGIAFLIWALIIQKNNRALRQQEVPEEELVD